MSNTAFRSRRLEWWERCQLESQGCRALNWSEVYIKDTTDLSGVRNVTFEGRVSLGALMPEQGSVIENTCLRNVCVGDYVTIRNVYSIEFEPEAACGIGTEVGVLDESGSRAVTIFPGLSAQLAMLMCRDPKWKRNHLEPLLSEALDAMTANPGVGDRARIENCGTLLNVSVGRECVIDGARNLRNGMIVNNAGPGLGFAGIGPGTDAENFIVEDGYAGAGAMLRNCYVGQGAVIEKGFSAHDSLFFANCMMENGEACALFAGPYTTSVHKASLLIGCQTSFMNAGSGTNQSNHMYKLGPVHWGLLERGVKTSSGSYLMLGAKIGAFSLLMGHHKTHPDSSQFPFSYLFGDEKGATVVVPGVMLRSCGLLRDEHKWPARDRRQNRRLPLRDRIVFDVLNPLTVDKMLSASEVIEMLLARPIDDDRYLRYRGMKFTRAALDRARHLYELGIFKYLHLRLEGKRFPRRHEGKEACDWVDVAGLPMPRTRLRSIMEAGSLQEMERGFDSVLADYRHLEKEWIAQRFGDSWRKSPAMIAEYAAEVDRMVEEDRARYLADLAAQNDMLAL